MASISSRWIEGTARAAALLGTTYLLLATGAPPFDPQVCLHAAETIRVAVSGDCGPSGVVTIGSAENQCGITASGAAAVNLPSAGRFVQHQGDKKVSLRATGWALSGTLVSADSDAGTPATSDAGATTDAAAQDASPHDGGQDSTTTTVMPTSSSSGRMVDTRTRVCTTRRDGAVLRHLSCTDPRGGERSGAPCTATLTELP